MVSPILLLVLSNHLLSVKICDWLSGRGAVSDRGQGLPSWRHHGVTQDLCSRSHIIQTLTHTHTHLHTHTYTGSYRGTGWQVCTINHHTDREQRKTHTSPSHWVDSWRGRQGADTGARGQRANGFKETQNNHDERTCRDCKEPSRDTKLLWGETKQLWRDAEQPRPWRGAQWPKWDTKQWNDHEEKQKETKQPRWATTERRWPPRGTKQNHWEEKQNGHWMTRRSLREMTKFVPMEAGWGAVYMSVPRGPWSHNPAVTRPTGRLTHIRVL